MPLLPPKLMSRPAVAVGLASIILFSAFLATTGLLLPILLQNVLAHSASQTGLILSAYSMTMCILAPISGHLADRYCASCMMVAGAGLAALVATTYAVAGDSLPLRGFALGQLAVGLAAGLFYAPNRLLMFDGL